MSVGRLIVICAPSGGGKTTVCRRLLAAHPQWRFSISATTRPHRSNERDGDDYLFLTDEQFDQYLAAGRFVEWQEVFGQRYGTLRDTLDEALENGTTILLDVDVKGGLNIKKLFPAETVAIFIAPPSEEILIERLKARGTEDAESVTRRLERLPEEMKYQDQFDHIVINDNLEKAVEVIDNILTKEYA